MVQPVVVQEVQSLIRSVQRKITVYFSTALRRHDLTISQFALLVQLSQQSPQRMSELAKRLYVSMPAVTHLVDRLVEKGLVKRAADPTDRRVCLTAATRKGSRVVKETQGYLLQLFTGSLEGMQARDHAAVIQFYKQFNRTLEAQIR